jgi:hypothetical protein
MNCCEYHGVSCDQGRTCPLRNRDEQADYPPTTPEEAESWVLPTVAIVLFFAFAGFCAVAFLGAPLSFPFN